MDPTDIVDIEPWLADLLNGAGWHEVKDEEGFKFFEPVKEPPAPLLFRIICRQSPFGGEFWFQLVVSKDVLRFGNGRKTQREAFSNLLYRNWTTVKQQARDFLEVDLLEAFEAKAGGTSGD